MDRCDHVYWALIGSVVGAGVNASLLVYALVELARTPHSTSNIVGIVVVSIILVIWLGVTSAWLFPWSALGRILEPHLSAILWLLRTPCRCARRRLMMSSGGNDEGALPQFIVQSDQGYSIGVLPREPPAGTRAPVAAIATAADILTYEQPADSELPDGDGSLDCA